MTGDVLQYALIISFENVADSWVVDSGASFHATPDKKNFLDYVQGDFGQVRLGDDKPCKIVRMGKVLVKHHLSHFLHDCFLVVCLHLFPSEIYNLSLGVLSFRISSTLCPICTWIFLSLIYYDIPNSFLFPFFFP